MADADSDSSGEDFGSLGIESKQSTLGDMTKLTGSQKTSREKALDIAHFFVLGTSGSGEKKRICKECG